MRWGDFKVKLRNGKLGPLKGAFSDKLKLQLSQGWKRDNTAWKGVGQSQSTFGERINQKTTCKFGGPEKGRWHKIGID